MQKLYTTFLALAVLCLVTIVVLLVTGSGADVGPAVVGFFVSLAIGIRRLPVLRDFAFTTWIFAAVSAAMFYPEYFLRVGDFELKQLIVPLIQLIMFGMGTALSFADFGRVARMPKGVLIGSLCQYTIMPLLGVTLALLFGFPPEIAAGVVLIGSAPGGVASNVMAYIAGANLPLSVTLTAVSTILSPFVTPALMTLLAGQFVELDAQKMMWDITKMVLLPVGAGLLFNRLFHGKLPWLDRSMPVVSMTGIAVIITIITATGRDSLLVVGPLLVLAAIIHNAAGYSLGYWAARLFKLPEQDCRTVAIEVGMQNGGLASGIALAMGKVGTIGLAPAIFGPWMNISGSALANYWRRTAPKAVHEKEVVAAAT